MKKESQPTETIKEPPTDVFVPRVPSQPPIIIIIVISFSASHFQMELRLFRDVGTRDRDSNAVEHVHDRQRC